MRMDLKRLTLFLPTGAILESSTNPKHTSQTSRPAFLLVIFCVFHWTNEIKVVQSSTPNTDT